MSSGADCSFFEETAGNWFYEIQCYPYGDNEDFDKHGPFSTFRQAERHLDRHYQNPGGYSISALPDCKHGSVQEEYGQRECNLCGNILKESK